MIESKIQGNLHGVTLELILMQLIARYGFNVLSEKIPINCFKNDPSLKSSLTYLRKTPWAREKVEWLYTHSKFDLEIFNGIKDEFENKKKK